MQNDLIWWEFFHITAKHILSHWMTHICVSKLTIIGSDNGLLPGRCQAIIWTYTGILLIGPLGTNFNEILIKIHIFSFKKMHLKMSSGKWRPFCLGLNMLTVIGLWACKFFVSWVPEHHSFGFHHDVCYSLQQRACLFSDEQYYVTAFRIGICNTTESAMIVLHTMSRNFPKNWNCWLIIYSS